MNIVRQINILKDVAEDTISVSNARVVAAVIYKGKIVSIGVNQNKTHPNSYKYRKNDKAIYIHAEVDAINKASKRLNSKQLTKATIIICRVKKNEENKDVFGLSKPCKGCEKCISDKGILNIIYTEDCKVESEMKYTRWQK